MDIILASYIFMVLVSSSHDTNIFFTDRTPLGVFDTASVGNSNYVFGQIIPFCDSCSPSFWNTSKIPSAAPLGCSAENALLGEGRRFWSPPRNLRTSGRRRLSAKSAIESSHLVLFKKIQNCLENVPGQVKVRPKVKSVTFRSVGCRDGTNNSCERKLCQNPLKILRRQR